MDGVIPVPMVAGAGFQNGVVVSQQYDFLVNVLWGCCRPRCRPNAAFLSAAKIPVSWEVLGQY